MKNKLVELSTIISKDLGVPEFGNEDYAHNKLRESLITVIDHLLDRDFNRLMNTLYRIDISEDRVKLSLSLPNSKDITIADLIIARQLEKAQTREKYSGI